MHAGIGDCVNEWLEIVWILFYFFNETENSGHLLRKVSLLITNTG